jgi:hypothetical protein
MKRNAANQTVSVYVYNPATRLPVTGRAADISVSSFPDDSLNATYTGITELDSVRAPGVYTMGITSVETDCDRLTLAGTVAGGSAVFDPLVFYPESEQVLDLGTVPIGSTGRIVLYLRQAQSIVTVQISKNGAAFTNPSGGFTAATAVGSGWYYYTPSAADTGTEGSLVVRGVGTKDIAFSAVYVSSLATVLDNVAITAPAGVASNFREMVVQLWRRFFKKYDHDEGAGTLKTYGDNGTSVLTTQTITETGDTTSVGAAS